VGTVGQQGGVLTIRLRDARIAEPIGKVREVYFAAIPRRMGD
jgi:hypothetical protein